MTPLHAKIREIIESSGPLSPDELQRAIRVQGLGKHPVDQIERLLRDRKDLFRPNGSGKWDLAENVASASELDHSAHGERVDPLIAGGLTDEFVVIDIETTGTDPVVDEIVQVAAVLVQNGRLVSAFNRYTRTVRTELPESLRVRMGWQHVDGSGRVDLDEALESLGKYIGHRPVVAWNAQFEWGFLADRGLGLERLIDGLAIAMLIKPIGPHRLTEVALSLGVSSVDLPVGLDVIGHDPRQFAAHDAVFDSYLAALVHLECTSRLRGGLGPEVASLLPELELPPVGVAADAPSPSEGRRPDSDAVTILRELLALQGRESRSAQERVAALGQHGLASHPVLIEAPTGTGKTLAYISAAMATVAAGGRVALVTAFKNLQDQLVAELDDAIEALGLDIRTAVLKGGDNYICTRRLQQVVKRLSADDADLRFVAAVLTRLATTTGSATREDISWWLSERFPRSQSLVDEVAVSCEHAGCSRAVAISAANDAQLVILNQVLWLRSPSTLDPAPTVVIDEAHDLEEMATLAFTEAVGAAELHALANRLDPSGRRGLLDTVARFGVDVAPARQLVRRVRSAALEARAPLARFANAISPEVDPDTGGRIRLRRAPAMLHPAAWTAAADVLRDMRDALTKLAQALGQLAGDHRIRDPLAIEDLNDLAGRLKEQEELLWALTAVRETALVHFLEVEGNSGVGWRLGRSPIEVAPALASVWAALDGFVVISATLQTGSNDFTYVIDRLGLASSLKGGCHAIGTDFAFDERVLFGLSRWFESIPTNRFMKEFIEEAADEISVLARFGEGRQLALFTARTRLEAVGEAISESLARSGLPVLRQGHGSRASLLEEFRDRPESILLGTRSFWQGVDVPGESLSFLVIEKLPFPHLRDPVVEARLELVRRRSGSEFDDFLLPQMIIAFKQGFGRLVRGRGDRGVVLLLDRRIHVKPYQRRVFDALPGFMPRDLDAERDRSRFYARIEAVFPDLITDRGRAFLKDLPTDERDHSPIPDLPLEGTREARRPAVIECMRALFGDSFTDFKSPEQEELFWRILDGDDVIGLLPTGAGKSLPFQLAALGRPGLTLVVSPLVALMRDQVENLLDRGVRSVGALVGAMSADERDEILRQATTGRIRLLYVAPERLRDPVFLDRLANLDVVRLVVDEAHCVSLWGPSFRPDFLAVRPALDQAGHHHVPVAALTATATPDIERDIRRSLRLETAVKVAMPFARPELRLAVISEHRAMAGDRISNRKNRMQLLLRILTSAERRGEAAIVYVPTVREADQITTQLRQVGLLARAYHGKMDPWSRQDVEELFREGEIDIVVATKAFGMGIDRSDVRYVIHVGHPADLESYYQEAGRAGRDGRDAHCILLALGRDRSTQEWFIDQVANLDQSLRTAHDWLSRLGEGRHLVDLQDFTEQLQLDDETQTRVLLHYLEASEAVTRHADQTILARAVVLSDLDDHELGEQLMSVAREHFIGFEIDLVQLAGTMGIDPIQLEQRLLEASRREELTYRPMVRAAVIDVHPTTGAAAPDTSVVVAQMRAKLDQLLRYIEGSECRQVTIRRYLGEVDPADCGVCDVCSGSGYPRPWMEITRDSLPDADRLFDSELTVLSGVDWNESELRAGRSPYGLRALRSVLAGDRYSLAGDRQGADRARRIKRGEASPYWGALALATNPSKRIEQAIQRLHDRGEIATASHTPKDSGQVTPYDYLIVTEAGRERLERGTVDR